MATYKRTGMNNPDNSRLIIVSNRLPVVMTQDNGRLTAKPGSGGLVTALAPVLRDRGGLWIGWPGTVDIPTEELKKGLSDATRQSGFGLVPVNLTPKERDNYYYGFANEVLWPLFHDLLFKCVFDPYYWLAYRNANIKFAQVIKENRSGKDYIWVHDYHLMNVALELRELGIKDQIGFFLHTPFPPLDIFIKLPWRFQILDSLLNYDLIGFQTIRDRRNFLQCVRALIKNISVEGKGQVFTLKLPNRHVRVGAFPISIYFKEFSSLASSQQANDWIKHIREQLPNYKLILGVDRLDYTKGIPERIKAFGNALERYPDLRERVVFVQVVVPSRQSIPGYQDLKTEIERLISQVNGRFTRAGWVPIHYIFRSMDREELTAYYRTSDIALITPLKDGMNLVAKEYSAASIEEDGVLILSEFAGSASQLQRGAILVNPYDIQGVADEIYRAFHMPCPERRQLMQKLRVSIRRRDIFWWVNAFLQAAISKKLDNFPTIEDYVPHMDINE